MFSNKSIERLLLVRLLKKVVFWSPAEYSPRKTCKTTGIDTFESSFVVCFREF